MNMPERKTFVLDIDMTPTPEPGASVPPAMLLIAPSGRAAIHDAPGEAWHAEARARWDAAEGDIERYECAAAAGLRGPAARHPRAARAVPVRPGYGRPVATINIASLAAGAESATMYIRNTTPAIGSLLGPRFNRIVATVASWT